MVELNATFTMKKKEKENNTISMVHELKHYSNRITAQSITKI
jgi:uncharacterized FlgJ-related protein